MLEVSINGGAFTDILTAGGSFVTGSYTGQIDGTANNPLSGRMAWSGSSGGYINTVVNLGPNVNGRTIRLRFRMGTDEATEAPGWRIDTISVTYPCNTPTSTPKADFDGDGNSDIIWEDSNTGERLIWLMTGPQHTEDVELLEPGRVGREWQIAGTGNFGGEGHVDILWQNSDTGERLIWLTTGTQPTGSVQLLPPGVVGREWQIVGTGNFGGEGHVDILWQNSNTGELFIWFMTGTQHTGNVQLLPPGMVGREWQIAGTDDFDRDGQVDILWQNSDTGERLIWLMTGTQHTETVELLPPGVVGREWQIVGTGNFGGHGQADILLQNNNTGERQIWFMTGTQHTGSVQLLPPGVVGREWDIRNH